MQNNLKAMLGQPKHQTLDMQGQSAAIHHLRMQVCRQVSYNHSQNNNCHCCNAHVVYVGFVIIVVIFCCVILLSDLV